jgi:CHAT domain-containing protein
MKPWILIAHADDDLRDEAQDVVLAAWKVPAESIVHSPNADRAREEIFKRGPSGWLDCKLIVVGITLPTNAATPLSVADQSSGMEFVRTFREGGCRAPVIFTGETSDIGLSSAMRSLAPNGFVRLGPDWSTDLRREVTRFANGSAPPERPRCVNLDIIVRGDSDWSWRFVGKGTEDSGHIRVEPSVFEKVRRRSVSMAERVGNASWHEDLSDIREELTELLFSTPSNRMFYKALIETKTRVGGTQNTRLRFVVNERTHPIVLEAIEDVDADRGMKYLMLKAPVYRRYEARGEGYPLFKDRASRRDPINCLIVQADPNAGELGAPWNTPLEALPNIEAEVNAVHEILNDEREKHGSIGELEVFRAGQYGDRAVDELEAVINRTRWHLVHFAGHAVRAGDKGAIVLRSRDGGALGAPRIGELLAKTQFLYLSSCKSADAYFVMNLVEQRVPGVLGFRWPVSDTKAFQYARRFYDSLFNDGMSRKFLEYAFLKAKRRLHEDDEHDPTWAAPVLIMQVDTPEEDPVETIVADTTLHSTQAGFRDAGGTDVRNATSF